MTETTAALPPGTTHLLHFSYYCGASRIDKLRGTGLWMLRTSADFNQGIDTGPGDWSAKGRRGTPAARLTAWVSSLVGYQVTLTRDDNLTAPPSDTLMTYRVSPATR